MSWQKEKIACLDKELLSSIPISLIVNEPQTYDKMYSSALEIDFAMILRLFAFTQSSSTDECGEKISLTMEDKRSDLECDILD